MPPGRPPKERTEEQKTGFDSKDGAPDGIIKGTITGPGIRREEFLRAIVEQAPKSGTTIDGLDKKVVRAGIEAYLEITRAFKGNGDLKIVLDSRLPAWDCHVLNAR